MNEEECCLERALVVNAWRRVFGGTDAAAGRRKKYMCHNYGASSWLSGRHLA